MEKINLALKRAPPQKKRRVVCVFGMRENLTFFVTGEITMSTKKKEEKKTDLNTEQSGKKDGKGNKLELTGQAAATMKKVKAMLETKSYMGPDTTPFKDIAYPKVVVDRKRLAVHAWLTETEKMDALSDADRAKFIKTGIAKTKSLVELANKETNKAAKNFADRAIVVGLAALQLKKLNAKSTTPFGVFAEEQMPFLNIRNRQKYMMLARRKDCHPFTYLGVDLLEVLCSLTKGAKDDNAIGKLLSDYDIPFDETSELDMESFKKAVNVAIGNERLKKGGIEMDLQSVQDAIQSGIKIDTKLIKRLKDSKKSNGDPAVLLQNIIDGDDDGDTGTTKERLQDFNTLGNRLIKTMDYILKDSDKMETTHKETFELLFAKFLEMKAAIMPDKS